MFVPEIAYLASNSIYYIAICDNCVSAPIIFLPGADHDVHPLQSKGKGCGRKTSSEPHQGEQTMF